MRFNIKIHDDRYFIDVASVVDRKDFITEIEKIRSRLKIEIPLSINEALRVLSDEENLQIDREVDTVRKNLYLPETFKSVILAAAFRNEITDEDYSPAYLKNTHNGTFDKDGATPDETFSIVISPQARDKDVIRAFQEYRDQLGNIKGLEIDYIHQVWAKNKKKPSIRKYRDWYIGIESGKTFKKICEEEIKKCPIQEMHNTDRNKPKGCTCFDESTIRKGVETYESLIWKTPTS